MGSKVRIPLIPFRSQWLAGVVMKLSTFTEKLGMDGTPMSVEGVVEIPVSILGITGIGLGVSILDLNLKKMGNRTGGFSRTPSSDRSGLGKLSICFGLKLSTGPGPSRIKGLLSCVCVLTASGTNAVLGNCPSNVVTPYPPF